MLAFSWLTDCASFLSPEGRCYSFDERASGYARGEGVGCIILKRLDHALADKDPIRAVVRMTGSNQDGRTPGISFPSRTAQMALIKSVYERAGLDPLQTSYVEAHGTGTQAGDPIEMSAISETMCSKLSADKPLAIGSVKTNIGHLEAASGIAALIKAVLMLENRVIFPNRNFETPNPRIPLKQWKLKVSNRLDLQTPEKYLGGWRRSRLTFLVTTDTFETPTLGLRWSPSPVNQQLRVWRDKCPRHSRECQRFPPCSAHTVHRPGHLHLRRAGSVRHFSRGFQR